MIKEKIRNPWLSWLIIRILPPFGPFTSQLFSLNFHPFHSLSFFSPSFCCQLISSGYTFTSSILSTTLITELKLAPACHMVTSPIFLHPELTPRTLLISLTFHKFQKFFILLCCCVGYLILLTGHVWMPLNLTI